MAGIYDYLPFDERWGNVFADAAGTPGAWDQSGMNNSPFFGSPFATADAPIQPTRVQTTRELPPSALAYSEPPASPPAPAGSPGFYGGSPATNPLLAPQDPQNAPQRPVMPPGMPQGIPSLGIGDRLGAGFQGAGSSFMNGGGPIGALVNLFGGLITGKRTDPQGVANEEAIRMYKFLQTKEGGGLSPAQAQSVVMHPELAKEYYKNLTSGQPVILPDGTIAMPGSFGAPPQVVGSAAKPELKERYNQATGRMELTAVTPPTIGNPRMGVTTPGGGGPTLPGQGAGARLPGQADISFATAPSAEEKKTQEEIGGGLAKDYVEIQKQAMTAAGQRTTFQRMRQLNAMPKLGEGQLAPLQQTFRSAMVSLGLGDASKVKPGEEFNSLANNMVLEASGGSLGNQISEGDRRYMAARIPSLENTKEGRAEMLDTLELLAQRKVDIAKEATKYRMSHGGSLDGFQTHIADWAEAHPLFKDRPDMVPGSKGTGAPPLPEVGTIRDGYRYGGGNPADPKSWQKVQ